MLGGILTESLGRSIGEAFRTHDWSGVADELANTMSQLFSQVFSGMGPFGGFVGGIFGGLFGGVLGGLFGGGGSSSRRGESMSNPMYTYDVRAESLLTELLNATKLQRLQMAAAGGADAGDLQSDIYLMGGDDLG